MASVTFIIVMDMRTFAGYDNPAQRSQGGGGSLSDTSFAWDWGTGYHEVVTGTGFDTSGFPTYPTNGTVTGWNFGFKDHTFDPSHPFHPIVIDRTYWNFTDLSVPGGDFSSAITSDGTALAAYMPTMLAGNDTVRGSAFGDYLLGFDGNDTILGNAGNDTLDGGSGNDTLNGGLGDDIMMGGFGSDTYFVDSTLDKVKEGASDGIDTVKSSVTYTLGANVDRLTLTGTAAIDGTGNSLNNILTGNEAANRLNGRDGVDTLDGGGARDILTGGAGADIFLFRDGDFGGSSTSSADRITDFTQSDGDRMDLHLIDSKTGTIGNQSFTFIGTESFHDVAGELRYQEISGNTYISGDTNGDGVADFMIRLDGLHSLTSGDFVL
jgi:Ca2+-binding RTX toxin-like protein